MHELLKEYISKIENEQREKLNREKNDFLLSKGLYEKEYSENNSSSLDYPCQEWDNEKYINRYFKRVPIEVSDEEYYKLLELSKTKEDIKETNTMANILTAIAWIIFIAGFIAGIALGNVETGVYYTHTEFSFAVALIYWAVSFISGIFILGFAEIIKLLNDIKNK